MANVKNYIFNNEKLFEQALTHSSFGSNNYERLEFLGDSILDFVIAKYYFKDNNLSEGLLSRMRAHTVSQDNLCQVFDNLNLKKYVKLGNSCKRLTNSMKCDMFEALVAAIFLDSNLETCEKFVLDTIFLDNEKSLKLLDSKSKLQEIAQAKKLTVSYEVVSQTGQSHQPIFTVKAKMGKFDATAKNKNKQIAEKMAAQKILDKIDEEKN